MSEENDSGAAGGRAEAPHGYVGVRLHGDIMGLSDVAFMDAFTKLPLAQQSAVPGGRERFIKLTPHVQDTSDRLTDLQRRYRDRSTGEQKQSRPRLLVTRASDVKPQPIRWLWPARIAAGKLTMLIGDPGLGKSLLVINVAAHVTTGRAWPLAGGACPLGDVLIASAEDDPADTIRPRLDAAGADSRRVHLVGNVISVTTAGDLEQRVLSLRKDIEPIRVVARALPELRLIVLDPISAYLGDTDSHNNSEVRGLLAPVADMAAEFGVAILIVSHLNKGTGSSALYRATGSLAFVAAARAAYLVSKDKADPSRRLFLPLKNNLGPDSTGLAYHIAEKAGVPLIEWANEAINVSADDALGRVVDEPDTESTLAEAASDWLLDELGRGSVATKDLRTGATAAGFSWATIRRAQAALGIRPQRVGGAGGAGAWHWALPEDQKPAQMNLGEQET